MTQDWPLVRFVGEADIFNVPIRTLILRSPPCPATSPRSCAEDAFRRRRTSRYRLFHD
jgi:hypothetical protein